MAGCFADPEVLLAYHNATVISPDDARPLHFAAVEAGEVGRPFRQCNGLLQVFRADLRRYDELWDQSIDHLEGNVILAHDQWYFFLATALGKVEFVDEPLLDYLQHGSNTYGVKVKETALTRLLLRFAHYGDQDEWAARSAESRAGIIACIAEKEGRSDLLPLSARYRDLAARLRRRAAVYSGSSLSGRALAMLRTVGDYSREPWNFAPPSALRDIWKGVMLGLKTDPTRA
jgi:hypothetical protein